jgi:cell wall assembly regulator SMI1
MFRKLSESVNRNDINELEQKLGIIFPEEVKGHYLEYNGGIPDPNCWVMDNGEWHCVQQFLPMKHGKRTIESVYLQGMERGYLIAKTVPFANDPGGNYFCFNEAGQVYFYAMDVWSPDLPAEENRKKAAKRLAESFQEFVSGLEPDPEEDE